MRGNPGIPGDDFGRINAGKDPEIVPLWDG
jgi:hypothetical protein